jgi:hypothetical protein
LSPLRLTQRLSGSGAPNPFDQKSSSIRESGEFSIWGGKKFMNTSGGNFGKKKDNTT